MHKYTLMIDTNSYAGNFERELAAWLTGKTQKGLGRHSEYIIAWANLGVYHFADGEDIAGINMVTAFTWLNEHTVYVTEFDKEGYECVCGIFVSPNDTEYKTVGIYFSANPPDVVLEFIKRRAAGFNKAQRARAEFLYGKRDTSQVKFLDFRVVEVNGE